MGNSHNSSHHSSSTATTATVDRRDNSESLNSVHALGAAGGGAVPVILPAVGVGKHSLATTASSPSTHNRFFHLNSSSSTAQASGQSSTKRKTKSKDSLLNSSFDNSNCCLHQAADFLDVNSLLNSSTSNANTIGKSSNLPARLPG